MIAVEQLMVGDWVEYRHDFPDKIDGIAVGNNSVHLEKDGWVAISAINPIPLTTEILEKNFSSTPEWYFEGTTGYCLRIGRNKDTWRLFYGRGKNHTNLEINLSFVHELQHCLKLVGIDKDIVL